MYCDEGDRGPVACWLRCYAKHREWSWADLKQVYGEDGDSYLTDVWYGDARQHTVEWVEQLKARLGRADLEERRLQQPIQPSEEDALDAAVKAEATPLAWWEEEGTQVAQVSASPGGGPRGSSRAQLAQYEHAQVESSAKSGRFGI